MRRRAFVRMTLAAAASSPLHRLTVFAQDAGLPDASVATLRALAPVVLPSSLGRRGVGLVTDRFLERLRGHRSGVVMEHGYGRPEIRRTPESPAPRYIEQLAALEQAARKQGQPFERLTADAKRTLVEAALADAKVETLPALPNGRHVVSDLMAFYFQGSEANDLCYLARINMEKARRLGDVTVRPRPLV